MSAHDSPGGGRIAFAHGLRGVAVLAVLACHAVFGFWVHTPLTTELVGLPTAPANPPTAIAWLEARLPIYPSYFGVALFFLISGFVIPFSFQRQGRAGFLTARFFRIWPTYACGLACTLLVMWLARGYFGLPFAVPLKSVAAHLLMANDLAGVPSLDGIAWTLVIEVRFYLLCALLAPSLRGGRCLPFVLVGLSCAGLVVLGQFVLPGLAKYAPSAFVAGSALRDTAVLIPFLLLGTVFHYHHQGYLSAVRAAVLVAALAAAFAWAGPRSSQGGNPLFVMHYLVTLGVFAACYAARGRLGGVRGLSWVADVSYPVYVLHGFAGYCFMRVALEYSGQAYVVLGVNLALVLASSAVVHRVVEVPTSALGKRLAARVERWLACDQELFRVERASARRAA